MSDNLIDDQGFSALYRAKHGYMLINRYDTYVGRSISTYGEWSEDEVELFLLLCEEGDTVVEVGSNIGTHTIPIAKKIGKSGRLYSFEPQRIVYQNLCANISLNSLSNVECYQQAVSDVQGFVSMPELNYNIENNFGAIRVTSQGKGNPVEQVVLDKYLNLPNLKLLKVDAEEMELPVILGAKDLIQVHRPFMYLENNPGNSNETRLVEMIQSMNYTVYFHVTLLYSSNNFFNNSDDIFKNIASFNIFCVPNEISFSLELVNQFALKKLINPTPVPLS